MAARSAIVRVGLGALLLAAACLKLYGLGTSAVPSVGWFAQSWVQLLAAEWELFLGAWLLSGVHLRMSWLAALVTFVAFAAIWAGSAFPPAGASARSRRTRGGRSAWTRRRSRCSW